MKHDKKLPIVDRIKASVIDIWHSMSSSLSRHVVVVFLTLGLLPGVLYFLTEALRKPSTFHIAADTEVLDMVTTGVSATRWYVQQAHAILGSADPLGEHFLDSFPFSGLVEIGPLSNVRMVRYGNGPLQITLHGNEETDGEGEEVSRVIPVVTLENLLGEEASWRWADSASLEVSLEGLPFSGSLLSAGAIGSETYAATVSEPPPVLHEGRVIVMAKRLLSDLRYPVIELDLQLGDEVWVMDAKGKQADTACVFSVAEQNVQGIGVACHATGKTLLVSRFGGHVVKIEPGPWDVIRVEPTLQAMIPALFSVIYVSLQGLLGSIFRRYQFPLIQRRNIKQLARQSIARSTPRS